MSETETFAVVTGANRGIGLAITRRLVAEGYRVAACARQPSDALAELLPEAAGHVIVPLDLRRDETISEAARTVMKWSKRIDALVNCAGVASGSLFAMTRMDEMRDLFQVNTFGPLLFTQYISRIMTRNRAGSIVNIGSTAGLLADPGTLAYGGSKAALMHATRVLATEMDDAARAALDTRSALPGRIQPDDVADLVMFLVSARSAMMTGQVLRLDRGLLS